MRSVMIHLQTQEACRGSIGAPTFPYVVLGGYDAQKKDYVSKCRGTLIHRVLLLLCSSRALVSLAR